MKEKKAIFNPSGEKLGVLSIAVLCVSCAGFVPSEFISQISKVVWSDSVPSTKAIFDPSGEKVGLISKTELFVSWTGFVPSAFITQISASPSRVEKNAIFDPSG